jgi:hypothetical protein
LIEHKHAASVDADAVSTDADAVSELNASIDAASTTDIALTQKYGRISAGFTKAALGCPYLYLCTRKAIKLSTCSCQMSRFHPPYGEAHEHYDR